MSLPYNERAFDTEQIVEKNVSYPFWGVGDTKGKIITERVNINLANYQPLALDTPNRDDPTAILVDELPPQYIDAQVVEHVREYATVPGAWEEYVVYNWEAPGIDSTFAIDELTISSYNLDIRRFDNLADPLVLSYYYDYLNWSVLPGRSGLEGYKLTFSGDPNLLSVGDIVNIWYRWRGYSYIWGDLRYKMSSKPISFAQTPIIAKSGNDFLISRGSLFKGFYIASGESWTARLDPSSLRIGKSLNREPLARATTAKITHEYFYSRNPDDEFSPEQPFKLIDETGKEASTITGDTSPSYTEYAKWIGDGRWILSEIPILQRWKGNIWEITRTYVRAY